jgi:hypothetical protein
LILSHSCLSLVQFDITTVASSSSSSISPTSLVSQRMSK